MKNIYLALILVILFFYLFTRLFQINLIPASLYWDEASIGYNAYSILKTGKDEWGQFLPIHFKAFGEYKLPVYIYSVSLTELIFGLNIFAVRLPSVLFGLGVIYLTFFLGLKIYQNKEIAILAAFLITISSWFFIFSRTGYEAVAGLFWFMLMIYSWLKYKERKAYLLISAISFVFSIYSYNAYRVVSLSVLAIIILSFIKQRNFWKDKLLILTFFLIVFVSLIPIVNIYLLNKGDNRLSVIGIFDRSKKSSEIAVIFLRNYLAHFSPNFLLKGDTNLRSQQSGFGELYLVDILFILISFIYILKFKKYKLPFLLVLISFLPSAITKEAPHALRSLSAAPFLSLIIAHGIYIASKFKNKISVRFFSNKIFFYFVITVIYLGFFANYFYNFVKNYQFLSYDSWQYGYKKIYDNYQFRFNNFDNVVISDRYSQPYIFTLFYLKVDPQKFRERVIYDQSIRKATSLVFKIDKFTYDNVDFYDFPKGKDLIFAHPSERLSEIPYNDIIANPDGSVAFYVYQYIQK